MISPQRLQLELQVLEQQGIPADHIHVDGIGSPKPVVRIAARTNSGTLYTLTFDLADFPACAPPVSVHCMLPDKNGDPLNHPSSAMHVLSPVHRHTRICHYSSTAWTPRVSLFKVYIKCLLWLNMYELHLQTGHRIDYYLKHQ